MSESVAKLVFVNDERAGESVELVRGGVVILGRSKKQADIVIEDKLVSRAHAEVRDSREGFILKDSGSTHGTFLNGQRIRGAVSLSPDDVISLGSVKLRFSLETVPEADGPAVAGGSSGGEAAPSAPSLGATQFAGTGERDATRFMEGSRAARQAADDAAEHTRVISQDSTRFLDVEELGAKPGGEREIRGRSPLLGVAAVGLVLLLSLGYFALRRGGEGAGRGEAMEIRDEQYGFGLTLPPGWRRWKSPEGPVVGFQFPDPETGKSVARMQVFGDRSGEYVATGVSAGFRDYCGSLRERYPQFYLQGEMVMSVNGAHVIFFAYGREGIMGKGVFTLHGDSRLAVHCESVETRWRQFKAAFTDILGSFYLNEEQVFVDFPLATDDLRHRALSEPAALEQDARTGLQVGEDLLKRRSVRPDNLYRAVQALETCLQQCSAFSQPPDFYRKATETLAYARRQFRESVRDQRYAITRAQKQKDLAEVYWEANKLLQMVPDVTSPDYRYAYKLTKKHKEAVSKR